MERDYAMLTFQFSFKPRDPSIIVVVIPAVVPTMNDQECSMHSAIMKVF